MKTETPSPDELRQLLRGELDEEQARELYAQLAESDEALDLAEGIWAQETPLDGEDPPRLSDRRSRDIEREVFRKMHRTHLAEDAARFGSGAFLKVILELLHAALSVFGGRSSQPPQRRRP